MIIFEEQLGKVRHFIVASTERLYEMSIDRKRFIQKLQGVSEPIAEHICKCILYPDSPNYKHWIEEIADFSCRYFETRKRSFKVTLNLVKANMFQEIEDRNDAWGTMKSFYRRFQQQNKPYPAKKFDYTRSTDFFDAYTQIADEVSDYLVNSFDLETGYQDIQSIVQKILSRC